ncbi:hypothetical protein U879_03130 [Defluviimonas sp. 20V17]|nr:hypothetical protein U879_03130 [Defluviimonas sp. 20V17]
MAVEGQRFGLSREEARELLREILEIAKVAEQSLSQVEQYLDS